MRRSETMGGPIRFLLLLSTTLLVFGCGRTKSEPVVGEASRPVETYVLGTVDPTVPQRITGSVSSWKEQDVGFEVSGRVKFVQERGTLLEGRWEDSGKVRVEGEVLAELDDRSYQIGVSVAEAATQVAVEQIGVADSELQDVLPANLRAAVAKYENARIEYERYEEAGKTNAVSALDVLNMKTNRDVKAAEVTQVEASFGTKKAEKRSLEASLLQAKEQLENARWQLGRCQLYAPFTGEVSKVYVEAGGYVQPGQPVVHLAMMDPIQVDVAVSPETLQSLRRNESVQLMVPGVSEPVLGRIYELATVADPKTRTFRVSMLLRNYRRVADAETVERQGVKARTQNVLTPLKIDPADPKGRWYVESRRSLHQDDRGWFVWAGETPLGASTDSSVIAVKKVRVTPGDRYLNYQGIYVLRELTDAGALTAETILPLDLPADFPEGGKVLIDDAGWVLQPGQIVSVLLSGEAAEPGLFVPMNVVLPDGDGTGRIFVAVEGRARSIRINVTDRAGPLVRVNAVDPTEAALVGPGAEVIRQAHFLTEGEAVRVVRTHEVRP